MTKDKVLLGKYVRLSKEDGDDKESESIENQLSAINTYIKNHGSNWEIAGEYIDDGFTGLNFNRPNFQRMKQDIMDNKIDLIICTKQSRIGRDSSGVNN